jgi:hypothetical protein
MIGPAKKVHQDDVCRLEPDSEGASPGWEGRIRISADMMNLN